MKDEKVSLAAVLRDAPRDCWVALNENEMKVVGHGKTPAAAALEAENKGVQDPLLIRVPKTWSPRVY